MHIVSLYGRFVIPRRDCESSCASFRISTQSCDAYLPFWGRTSPATNAAFEQAPASSPLRVFPLAFLLPTTCTMSEGLSRTHSAAPYPPPALSNAPSSSSLKVRCTSRGPPPCPQRSCRQSWDSCSRRRPIAGRGTKKSACVCLCIIVSELTTYRFHALREKYDQVTAVRLSPSILPPSF